jgi:hypothetical protein
MESEHQLFSLRYYFAAQIVDPGQVWLFYRQPYVLGAQLGLA